MEHRYRQFGRLPARLHLWEPDHRQYSDNAYVVMRKALDEDIDMIALYRI